jgi:membrane protease YdiL (CAAX protease family)
MEDTQSEPFWTWKDLVLLLGLGLPAFVVVFFAAAAVLRLFTSNKALLLMIPQFAGQAAMLVPFALLCRWKYDQPLLPALRLGVRVRDAVRSFPAGLLLAVSVLALAALLRAHDTPSPMQDLMNDPLSAPWVAVFAVSIGPAFEEIFFRGLLQPVAARTAGVVGGILIGSVPFALLHGPQYAWSWRHVLLIAVAGSAFGWWRVYTRSTGASALMHAGYNAVLVFGYLIGRDAL